VHCVVTAGPTYEPLDHVRRLTNFSTGRLGSELARFLTERGHEVTLLIGEQATFRPEAHVQRIEFFATTSDLEERLRAAAQSTPRAVFHAAAVSDFKFGKIWSRAANHELSEVNAGKITTRGGPLLAELVPTTKIIAHLRKWFPTAYLVGWKYEVDGDRSDVVKLAQTQIAECRTNACIANGLAYGQGFGFITLEKEAIHLEDKNSLFETLAKRIQP
jgi:phosphopantothenate---cysteine ligase (CTP)